MSELSILAAQTAAFIAADPETLVVEAYQKVSDGAKGYTYNKTGEATVIGRLIPRTDKVPEVSTSDGRLAKPEYTLLLPMASTVTRYSRFTWRGRVWEIAQVHQKPDYQVKGDVVRYG